MEELHIVSRPTAPCHNVRAIQFVTCVTARAHTHTARHQHTGTAALALLEQIQPSLRVARIIGDNPLVVRHGAALGRLRHVRAEALMAGALSQSTAGGWALQWTLVGRDSNGAADGAAKDGAIRARAMADTVPRTNEADFRTEWF